MPAYFEGFTNRYLLKYNTCSKNHTIMWRYGGTVPAVPPASVYTELAAFLNAIQGQRFADWTPVSAAYSVANTITALPTGMPVGILPGLGPAGQPSRSPLFESYVGLSANGTRARLSVFGVWIDPASEAPGGISADYRRTVAEDAAVLAAVSALSAATSICAIDGTPVTWHAYANVGVNAHYQREARG